MDKRQMNKLSMYEAVYRLLQQNPQLWDGVNAFNRTVVEFGDKVKQIRETSVEQASIALGKGQVKANARKDLVLHSDAVLGILQVYALEEGKPDLERVLADLAAGIRREAAPKAHFKAQHLLELIHGNKEAVTLYGLTDEMIARFESAVDTFESEMVTPRRSIAQRKAVTAELKTMFAQVDELLNKKLDRLIHQFRQLDQQFVSRYNNVRLIVDYGTRKLGTPPGEADDVRGPTGF
ncbi:MAG: hypothetical protein KDC12_00115 [Flavobacteriales bacterium]|nr:hypothetical protein [Flavobacteriales bacterium]